MITFIIAVFLLLTTPGPGVLTLAGVGSAYGYRHGFRYLIGLLIGQNIVAIAVATGLAAILLAAPIIRNILLVLSVSYMIFLAYKIAFSGSKIAFIGASKSPGVRGGIILQIINPKAYVVNTSLFTGFSIWPDSFTTEITFKFFALNLIWLCIHILWLAMGVTIHRLSLSARIQHFINISMAIALIAVVGLALWAQFYTN
ncbi:LysE family translocator [Lentilitoribacter sp. EG35]|uniref:LysE family translocator n=1 Tax=Lentilitoribacter sp. EG35 TaxID=3234192 RepID=UPI00345F53AC